MRTLLSLTFIFLFSSSLLAQERKVADQIIAMVNDNIILKSEVDQRVGEFMQQNQTTHFNENMWYFVLESLIDNYVLVEKAKADSIIVTDSEVDRMLSQRINQLVQQIGSERELEQAFGQSIVEIKAEYRDQFRQDLLVSRVRQKKIDRISITRPEVEEFFHSIPKDSLPVIPESVSLSQITIVPPLKPDARISARNLAGQLRDSIIHHNASLEELAKKYSDGPTAARGGELPMISLSDLLPQYAAAASALQEGELSEIVDTPQGFHIIRLNERQGQRISTHHILISVPDDVVDDAYAIDKLTAIRDSVKYHQKPFSLMARRHSDDRNTAPAGGRLINPQTGQRLIAVNDLDPSLYRIVLLLENPGDISSPQSYQYGEKNKLAYRIVKLNDRVDEHVANLKQDYSLIRNFALQQKSQRKFAEWVTDLRDEMYINYQISVPDFSELEIREEHQQTFPDDLEIEEELF